MIIDNDLIYNLLYSEEGVDLDFKRDQYKFSNASDEEKGELLKDILAFANSWRRSDAFILIGVKEVKGGKSEVVGIKEKLDDAQIQQFVNSKTQKPIIFSYCNVKFENNYIGIIHIPIQNRPFYLNKDYGKLKKETVYIKRGSSTDIAKLDEVSKMGISVSSAGDNLPVLEIFFANKEERITLPNTLSVYSLVLNTPPKESIPYYEGTQGKLPWSYSPILEQPNRNYYREITKFTMLNRLHTPVNFAIKNSGNAVAKDVRIEIKIKDEKNIIKALDESDMPDVPRSSYSTLPDYNFKVPRGSFSHELTVKRILDYWLIETSLEKVQPQRTEWIESCLFIGAIKTVKFSIETVIYSDNLPDPIKKELLIKVKSESKDVSLDDIMKFEKDRFKKSMEYKRYLEIRSDKK